ncbi:Dynein heavy chain, cytoplasmic [Zancudomyces culisetae]|uniref:Dynein heavy chain, cytoplasmic n=1 Tax=Zancudomyces culisetae TaxID=1213189 RepID=A0A1R1PX57_ZANCU|nr:Dynein heavy chain, cytoplasmic [Zancudomyces culisetae]|eukprot:OMH85518.1 Dynein heavy chain, cytoplasmic [Zancudomyces culisetae]
METSFSPITSTQLGELDPITLCDIKPVIRYIETVTTALLGGDNGDDSILSLLELPESQDKCQQFIRDPQTPALYIIKEIDDSKEQEKEDELDDDGALARISYTTSTELEWTKKMMGAVVLIKRSAVLEGNLSLSSQLQPSDDMALDPLDALDDTEKGRSDKEKGQKMLMGTQTPYEAMHSLIHYGVTPYFNAFVNARQRVEAENEKEDKGRVVRKEIGAFIDKLAAKCRDSGTIIGS